ncbi:trypsin-like peptidase domain-containing protein [bacterium]|nr:trypsin-like peptidase domain-containing protein [bacterium]
MSSGAARRIALVSSAAFLGGGAVLAAHAREILAEQRSASEGIDLLGARLEHEERSLRLLEKRAGEVAAALERERARDREEHARLTDELERLRAADAQRTRSDIATLDSRVSLLQAAADRAAQARSLDAELVRRECVEPTVRVNAKSEVGSGTLVWSRKRAGRTRTFVLTAWHIVKDNAAGEGSPVPIEVDIYDEQSRSREERGRVVARNESLDLALLEVESERTCGAVARLPRPQELERATVFARVHAIGCPLGYSPLATSGEITSRNKELDGLTYWMVSAPTIFGNSGGGIYLSETRQLVGILSRISAYKSLIDVAVPHMGIVTPISQVYDWLDSTEFAFIHKEGVEGTTVVDASQPR